MIDTIEIQLNETNEKLVKGATATMHTDIVDKDGKINLEEMIEVLIDMGDRISELEQIVMNYELGQGYGDEE